MKYYEKQLKASKYNIKVRPYKLSYNGFDNPLFEGIKNGNPYEYKQKEYQGYDIIISNIYHKPMIQLVGVDFKKEYYAMDKHYDYPKI